MGAVKRENCQWIDRGESAENSCETQIAEDELRDKGHGLESATKLIRTFALHSPHLTNDRKVQRYPKKDGKFNIRHFDGLKKIIFYLLLKNLIGRYLYNLEM